MCIQNSFEIKIKAFVDDLTLVQNENNSFDMTKHWILISLLVSKNILR